MYTLHIPDTIDKLEALRIFYKEIDGTKEAFAIGLGGKFIDEDLWLDVKRLLDEILTKIAI